MDVQEKIQDNLRELEVLRQEKLSEYQKRRWQLNCDAPIFIACWASFTLILLLFEKLNVAKGIFGIGILFAMSWYCWLKRPEDEFKESYKKTVLPRLAQSFGLYYNIEGQWQLDDLERFCVIPNYDSREKIILSSEDHFQGKYQETKLHLSEVHLGIRALKYTKTLFNGLFVRLSFTNIMPFAHNS